MSVTAQHIAVVKLTGGVYGAINNVSAWDNIVPGSLVIPAGFDVISGWADNFLSNGYALRRLSLQSSPGVYLVYVLTNDTDTQNGSRNGMELLAKFLAGAAFGDATMHNVNTPEAASAFTGGDVQLFRSLISNLRDQNSLV